MHRNKVDTKSADTIFAQVFIYEKKQTEAQILNPRNKVDTKSVDTIFAQVFIYESLDRMMDIWTNDYYI